MTFSRSHIICFGLLDGFVHGPCLVPKLVAGVASEKIDQRGTGEGNKADGEYRYCNGRRYCHYSGPYTDHASTQWSIDPSKEVPTLPLCLISSSICRLLRSKWTLLAQHHNAGCGRPAGHLISSISHRPGARAFELMAAAGLRPSDKKRMAAALAPTGCDWCAGGLCSLD